MACSGAAPSMKTGTILWQCRYDGAVRLTLQSVNLRPKVLRYVQARAARPFLAAIREITGPALRWAVFLKVPCDRPTFAAPRGYCIPPRGPGRACVRNQRTRARGMRRLGRDGRVLRRFVALS
jgi:hypothetical protein